ncbi:hypothetical protein AAFF_G00023030 [Aldrovandia affinis]|uniref:Glutathione hydrolase n=1 Tax=Aldrovandia affinis TaxID=143900 RepID=A0AAD7WZI9_9TELE|nr:hypothetical protein AAFF_G00023030 [Aldrovandia affinis]
MPLLIRQLLHFRPKTNALDLKRGGGRIPLLQSLIHRLHLAHRQSLSLYTMARSKTRVRSCACLVLLCVIAIIVSCIVVFTSQVCSEGDFKHAAVSADSETCSKIGRDILQKGGSAVDGAIAALLCTSLVNPQSTGLGGGSIFTVREKSGKAKVINSREATPKVFKPDLMKECSQSLSGSQWIGVPGELRGPPSNWPERVPVFPVLSYILQKKQTCATASPLQELLCHKNKTAPKLGEKLKFNKLADTMEIIANQGPDAFYNGKIARDLIRDVQDAGGTLSLEDLKSFRVKVTDAWTVTLGDYTMHIPPPPAGGALVGFILNVMKGYSLSPASMEGDQKTLTYHRYVETYKFANGLRKNIRDPNFSFNMGASQLITEELAERVRAMIDSSRTHDSSYYNLTSSLDSLGTSHVSVLDEDGMAVSVTSTINYFFGSNVYSPNTGVILNNELTDFCGKVDPISAGEQPPSSMSPAVLYSEIKQKILVIGASGGSMITNGIPLAIMNHLWFGKDLEEAISAPVLFVDSKNSLRFEPTFDKTVVEALKGLGHNVENKKIFYNVVNAVVKTGSCISAVSDARKKGKSAGY